MTTEIPLHLQKRFPEDGCPVLVDGRPCGKNQHIPRRYQITGKEKHTYCKEHLYAALGAAPPE